jgi:hypothetical protein
VSTPFATYYAARVGRWRGTFFLEVTSWRAFLRTKMSFADRARIVLGLWMARVLGPPTMFTSVTYPWEGDASKILHTTRVAKWGMTAMTSREVFELRAGDGAAFGVKGEIRFRPGIGVRDYGASSGEILPDASRAKYHFVWMGQPLEQRTADVGGKLAIVQDTAYSRGLVVLERYAETP